MKRINKFPYFAIFILPGLFFFLIITSAINLSEDDILLLFVTVIIFAYIVGLVLHYKLWKAIQDPYTSITPGRAVGFLFIPVYNYYWVFRSVYGFANECNAFLDRNDIQTAKLPSAHYLVQSILYVFASVLFKFESSGVLIFGLIVASILYTNYFIITNWSINAVNNIYSQLGTSQEVNGA